MNAVRFFFVVPTLDSHPLLPRLVDSLRRQSWPHWRVVFIDGPSGSEHRAALERICAADPRFSWTPQHASRPGIFGAMNQGFALAAPQDWVLFWGSDDWAAAPDVLEQLARRISSASESCDLLVCRGRYVRISPERLLPGRGTWLRCPPRADGRRLRLSLLFGSTPPHQATLFGPGARMFLAAYDESFRLAADLDAFLRLSTVPDLRVWNLPLEVVALGEGGVSGVQHRRRLEEVRRSYRRSFGFLWPLPFLCRYLNRMLSLLVPAR